MSELISLQEREQITDDNIQDRLNENPIVHYDWDAWLEMMEEEDAPWCFQDSRPLLAMQAFGRRQIRNMLENQAFSILKKKDLEQRELVKDVAMLLNENHKPFDIEVEFPTKTEKTIYVDVEKTIKTGFFKKETVLEKEPTTEPIIETKKALFEGWLLDSFNRKCYESNSVNIIRWDYCLGKDGELYLITSTYGWGGNINDPYNCFPQQYHYYIDKLIPFTMQVLKNKNQNAFIGVFCGLTYVLDQIPAEKRDEVNLTLGDDSYTYNFPLQVDNVEDNPYNLGQGLIARLSKLLPNK